MYKIISLMVFLFVSVLPVAVASHVDHHRPYDFIVTKDVYQFSEIYQINSQQTYPGSIKKSMFRIRTNYDLSNKNGWQATGIIRAISMGALYPWATDIDIYDTRGKQIALIDGSFATFESARFDLYEYDEGGNAKAVGIAYASGDFSRFVIFASNGNPHPIAEITRNFADRNWIVSVNYPENIDDRLIRIFAGFVVDYQDRFLTPSK